jgi:glutathione S-transferase
MADIVIHTELLSPYGWTARHIASEKGLVYSVAPVDTASPAHRKLHPFAKMPVLQHGDVVVYETPAIAHYLDRAFPGPALQPVDCLGQSLVLRWISVVNSYLFPVVKPLVSARTAASWRGDGRDLAAIAALRAPLARCVAVIEETLSCQAYLVGGLFSIADSFLFPHLHFASLTPEGTEVLATAAGAQHWLDRMRGRASYAATNPLAELERVRCGSAWATPAMSQGS